MKRETKCAVITGAAGGIGAVVAQRLAEAGYAIAGLDLHPVIELDHSAIVDVTHHDEVVQAIRDIPETLGPIEVLVTAAGHYEEEHLSAIATSEWVRMLRVHLKGTANAIDGVRPAMQKQGYGAIITVSSELALAGGNQNVHYAAAKGAILGLTQGLAEEFAAFGVHISGVAPGPTDTSLLADDSLWRDEAYLTKLPLGRLVQAREVAGTVMFLVDKGYMYCGQTLSPNSGAVI